MKHMKRILAWVLVAVMLTGLCTGCGMSKEEYEQKGIALVVIVGRHANAHRYTQAELNALLGDKLQRSVERTINGDDYSVSVNCSILVVDGDPEQAYATYNGELVDLSTSAKSAEKALHELDYILGDIESFLMSDELQADDKEVDLLAAIAEGTTILNSYPEDTEKHMVIYDTGFNTTGFFDMNKVNIQEGDVGQIVNEERLTPGAFPDMKGIQVTFGGLGNVCYGQQDMRNDSVFKGRMEELWTAYFNKCGATLTQPIKYSAEGNDPQVYDDPDKNVDSGNAAANATVLYPYVSGIPFVIAEAQTQQIIDGETIIVLDSLSLGFLGDSAEFRDRDQALKALRSYGDAIERIKQDPSITLYVVGSKAKTAPDEEIDLTESLSEERAKAVAALLKEMFDFPEVQIQIINADITPFTWRNGVEFPDGTEESLDRDEQRKNRVVALIPSTAQDYVDELVKAGLLDTNS